MEFSHFRVRVVQPPLVPPFRYNVSRPVATNQHHSMIKGFSRAFWFIQHNLSSTGDGFGLEPGLTGMFSEKLRCPSDSSSVSSEAGDRRAELTKGTETGLVTRECLLRIRSSPSSDTSETRQPSCTASSMDVMSERLIFEPHSRQYEATSLNGTTVRFSMKPTSQRRLQRTAAH